MPKHGISGLYSHGIMKDMPSYEEGRMMARLLATSCGSSTNGHSGGLTGTASHYEGQHEDTAGDIPSSYTYVVLEEEPPAKILTAT
jgi:hypothetical protein